MSNIWACAQTHPQQEKRAIVNLLRQEFECFYPYWIEPVGRRKILKIKPVFPSYIFILLDPDLYNWSPINSTFGVRALLTFAQNNSDYRRPHEIPFAENLRELGKPVTRLAPGMVEIPVGTMVRVKRGPFTDHVGLVEMSGPSRVRLLLEVFQRETVVTFARSDIEVISTPLC
jgi:transcriptional antiterminator RfaH